MVQRKCFHQNHFTESINLFSFWICVSLSFLYLIHPYKKNSDFTTWTFLFGENQKNKCNRGKIEWNWLFVGKSTTVKKKIVDKIDKSVCYIQRCVYYIKQGVNINKLWNFLVACHKLFEAKHLVKITKYKKSNRQDVKFTEYNKNWDVSNKKMKIYPRKCLFASHSFFSCRWL